MTRTDTDGRPARVGGRVRRAACLTAALSALTGGALAAGPGFTVQVYERDSGRVLRTLDGPADVSVPGDGRVKLRVEPKAGNRVDRVLVGAAPGSDPTCLLGSRVAARHDTTVPFQFGLREAPDCRWTVTAYDDRARTKASLTMRLLRPAPGQPAPDAKRRYDLVAGTTARVALDVGPKGRRSEHGVRVFCTVSHLSYDDPIIHPGRPDAAHLHVFFGNTSTNAHSATASLKRATRSSCEAGQAVRSAYWMPALFDSRDQVVLPERFVTYYKTFVPGGAADQLPRGLVKPIPDGLEMLASEDTLNYGASRVPPIRSEPLSRDSRGRLRLTMNFPQCVAVDGGGRPVLSHRDMPGAKADVVNSHLAYTAYIPGSKTGCPQSHPYRIPGVTYNAYYDVDPNSRWHLASDTDRSRPGHSLHADYFAAWDAGDMAQVVRCNEEGRSCRFQDGATEHGVLHRADGERVYLNSAVLLGDQDRTPWGDHLKKMRHQGGHVGH